MEWAKPWQVWPGRVGCGTYPGRHGGVAQALLHAMGGPGIEPGSTHRELCGDGRHKGHAPGRKEGTVSLPQCSSLSTQAATGRPTMALTMTSTLAGGVGAGLHSGMAIAQAAALGHELTEGIVVEGVSLEVPWGLVTQCVQFGEVHMEISHMQKLWRHRL